MGIKWKDFEWSNMNYPIFTNKVLTDILCPNCGKYIYMRTDMIHTILSTYPPQYRYECECGWVGYSYNQWQKGLGE